MIVLHFSKYFSKKFDLKWKNTIISIFNGFGSFLADFPLLGIWESDEIVRNAIVLLSLKLLNFSIALVFYFIYFEFLIDFKVCFHFTEHLLKLNLIQIPFIFEIQMFHSFVYLSRHPILFLLFRVVCLTVLFMLGLKSF